MWKTAIFDELCIKVNTSATDRLTVVKFHKNIANRWLAVNDIKKNNGYQFLLTELF